MVSQTGRSAQCVDPSPTRGACRPPCSGCEKRHPRPCPAWCSRWRCRGDRKRGRGYDTAPCRPSCRCPIRATPVLYRGHTDFPWSRKSAVGPGSRVWGNSPNAGPNGAYTGHRRPSPSSRHPWAPPSPGSPPPLQSPGHCRTPPPPSATLCFWLGGAAACCDNLFQANYLPPRPGHKSRPWPCRPRRRYQNERG
jgi:hypothetical protein